MQKGCSILILRGRWGRNFCKFKSYVEWVNSRILEFEPAVLEIFRIRSHLAQVCQKPLPNPTQAVVQDNLLIASVPSASPLTLMAQFQASDFAQHAWQPLRALRFQRSAASATLPLSSVESANLGTSGFVHLRDCGGMFGTDPSCFPQV